MNNTKPEFHLRRIDIDGSASGLEIHPLSELTESVVASRRGFLGTGVAIGSLVALMRGGPAIAAPSPSPEFEANADAVFGPAHRGRVSGLAFGPSGGFLISSSDDGTIKRWSLTEATVPKPLPVQNGPVTSMALASDGKTLATGSDDGRIKIWALPEGTLRKTLVGHTKRVTGLAIAADTRSLLSSAMDGQVKRWLLPSGQRFAAWPISDGGVSALAASRDGRLLAAGTTDGMIQIRTFPAGAEAVVLKSAARRISALAISRDGKTLASGGPDRSLTLWDVADRKPVHDKLSQPASATAVAFMPSGGTLATGSDDRAVRLYSLQNGEPARLLVGHEAPISAIAISPDGLLLASGDDSGVVLLWDVVKGEKREGLFDPLLSQKSVLVYTVKDAATGHLRTYTLPCGSPPPANAVCVCNCVEAGGSVSLAKTVKAGTTTTIPGPSMSKEGRSYTMETFPSPPPVVSSVPDQVPGMGMGAGRFGGSRLVPRPPRLRGSTGGFGGGGRGGSSTCSCNQVCVCIPVCQAHRLGHGDPVVRRMAREILLVMGKAEFAYMRWASSGSGPRVRKAISSVMDAIRNGARPHPENWPGERECLSRLDHADEVVAIMAAQMLTLRDRVGGLALEVASRIRMDELLALASSRTWIQHTLTQ